MLPAPPEKMPIIQLAHPATNSRIDVPRSGNLRASLLQNRPRRLDQCRIDLDQDDKFEPDLALLKGRTDMRRVVLAKLPPPSVGRGDERVGQRRLILTYEVSDEALEAAATGPRKRRPHTFFLLNSVDLPDERTGKRLLAFSGL